MTRTACMLALAAALGGCATNKKTATLHEVNQLVGWIERVHTSAELAKERTHDAISELQSIADFSFEGEVATAFGAFSSEVDASSRQVVDLRKCLKSLKEAGEPVFKRWAADLETFASVELRTRSQARLTETRERYDAIVAAGDVAIVTFEAFDRKLRDYATFLSHDLNAASVAAIQPDIRAVVEMSAGLDARLDATQEAARVYVEAASMPTSVPAEKEPAPTKRASRG